MTPTVVTQHTMNTIERVLRVILAPWHYAGFDAEARLDSTDDPAIFITAWFEPADAMPPSPVTTQATRELLDTLRKAGDDRIPYLRYRYPEDRADDEAA